MAHWIGWLIVIIILTVIELATDGLVAVWFIASGLISLVVSYFTDSFLIQFAIFVLGGLLFLILTRPILQKRLSKNKVKTNLDQVIGMVGKVTEKISKNSIGEVYVAGKKWSAYSDEEISEDEMVTILAIDGVKLKVRKEK